MEYIAITKNIKMSPRKMRLVVDGVKKNNAKNAVMVLNVLKKRAAGPLRKTIESAMANAVNNFKAEKNDLLIKEITVTEGVSMKRFHFAARGRSRPYKRRTTHVRVILADNLVKAEPKVEEKVEVKKEKIVKAGKENK